jgi:general secretion pathway protein K
VVALFMVALVSVMAITMMARLQRDTERTRLLLRDTQATFYAQGSIAWAINQLRTNAEEKKQDQLMDVMPIRSPVEEVNGYSVFSTINDLQGRFNINNLVSSDAQIAFSTLLLAVQPSLTQEKAQAITLAVTDWVKSGEQHNEYTQYYFQLPRPYRPAHRTMLSVSELLLVKGMTPKLYQALQPYLTALPTPTLINVQTAEAPVLMTLIPNIGAVKAIMLAREKTPFITPDVFLNLEVVRNNNFKESSKFVVNSGYFLVETHVAIEKQQVVIYTLVERAEKLKSEVSATILWQSKGVC